MFLPLEIANVAAQGHCLFHTSVEGDESETRDVGQRQVKFF